MSAQVTFTIAGHDAEKLKDRIQEEANKKGMSVSQWMTDAAVEKLRNQNGQDDK